MTSNVGTTYSMAPEMLRGDTKYTSKVDVFSFGITIAGTIDGQTPYIDLGYSNYVLGNKVLEGLRPTVVNKDAMPKDFVKLMVECWDFDPKKRPSFDIIVKRLKTILDGIRD